ncbi:hypothetical protein [Paenibacillus tarimensis]|uniref:hypothetical protein n=1 Tax=Paenibacillus tarimensis TaxID=416012 RepID=UPI001F47C95D|nr:hypothetical protein [Paenibacillus tarimensis]MCF2946004.1 hypothetical protein [Paenibacillus tarimensis]
MTLPVIQFDLSGEWIIERNIFTEVDPDLFDHDDYVHKWEFNEDILQIINLKRSRIIDLGWYPGFNHEGQYCLILVVYSEDMKLQVESWNEPIFKYYTRNINEVRRLTEELIHKVDQGII